MSVPIRRVERLDLAIVACASSHHIATRRNRFEERFAHAARAALTAPLLDRGEGVWLIEQLKLDLIVDPRLPEAKLRQFINQTLAARLARALDPNEPGTRFFPSRAAYLSQFLSALITGTAWTRWEFATFEGLKLLSVPRAIVTAVLAEPLLGLTALHDLAAPERIRICTALDASAAYQMLEGFAALDPGLSPSPDQARHALSRALRVASPQSHAIASEALQRFLLAGSERAQQSLRIEAAASMIAVIAVRESPALRSSGDPTNFLRQRAALACTGTPNLLQGVMAFPALALEAAIDAHRSTYTQMETGLPRIIPTPWAGMAMLAPVIDEALQPLFPASQDAVETRAGATARLVTLIKCAGSATIADDPGMRAVFALPDDLSGMDAGTWLTGLPERETKRIGRTAYDQIRRARCGPLLYPGERSALAPPGNIFPKAKASRAFSLLAATVLRRFAHRLPGFSRSTANYLRANFLCGDGQVELHADKTVVLSTAPPIHVILSMTGLARGQHTLTWLGARPLLLGPLP
jgi:hypothetical protein